MSDLDLLSTYNFSLPQELIAQSPAKKRDEAKLLVVRRIPERGLPRFEDLLVKDLPHLIKEEESLKNYLWVRNVTKVLPARLYVNRKKRDGSGSFSRHELVFLEELSSPGLAKVILRGTARMHFPEKLSLEMDPGVELVAMGPDEVKISEPGIHNWKALLWKNGEMPLPPYIRSRDAKRDQERYQSLWADPRQDASAAAPTASLHFSQELIDQLNELKIQFANLCLQVGLGTFEPVRVTRLSEHQMHSEFFEVETSELQKLSQNPSGMLCVGTTALRALESLDQEDLSSQEKIQRRTEIFIKPGYKFKRTKALWTNFHLPESTLFVLITAFAGSLELSKEAYSYAVQKKYRFFSYGDASLWL